jgi:hypothetical protein
MDKSEEMTFWGEFRKGARGSWGLYWRPLTWTFKKAQFYVNKVYRKQHE